MQAQRLAAHLVSREPRIDYIFASDLQRAANTADEIRKAIDTPGLEVVRVPALRERDYGPWEGVKYGAMIEGVNSVGKPGAEVTADMTIRVKAFVDTLEALGVAINWTGCVAVVAHGVILSILSRALAARFPGGDMSQDTEKYITFRNTGYLEASIVRAPNSSPEAPAQMAILTLNNATHLDGLQKTGGGIGSASFDAKQKSIDTYFKPSGASPDTSGDGAAL